MIIGATFFALLSTLAPPQASTAQTDVLAFEHEGKRLVGLLDLPGHVEARSLLVIVQGHGPSNVVAQSWFSDLRREMTAIGVGTFVWDKPGCGQSEGEYDHHRPVQVAAEEVRAALRHLREIGVPGSDAIGFWGTSRGCWIVPLVIAAEPETRFWISVSGTAATESFGYLLRENLRIEGRTEAEVERLHAEWMAANLVTFSGGSYAEAQRAAPNLPADPFMQEFFPSGDEAAFRAYQERLLASNATVDESGLLFIVEDFDAVLKAIECPVLALFGERDCNVDWRKTRALYQRTLGAREPPQLSIETFPNGNHNLKQCQTGGWRETMATLDTAKTCEGYHESMTRWLVEIGASTESSGR